MRRTCLLAEDFSITRRDLWITAAAGVVCLLILRLQPPCLILKYFHVPCPACGMTRAWNAALHLHLAEAFRFHPMFWSVPVLYVYILHFCHVFRSKVLNRCLLGGILLGFGIHYLVTLIRFFHLT